MLDVHNDVDVIQQRPAAFAGALAARGLVAGPAHLLLDLVDNGVDLPFVGSRGDDEAVGDDQLTGDVDDDDVSRFRPGAAARAYLRGNAKVEMPLTFVRVEPYLVPKKSLTGDGTERVDTRVMQAIYSLKTEGKPVYVGQQLDVFIDVSTPKSDNPVAPPESLTN